MKRFMKFLIEQEKIKIKKGDTLYSIAKSRGRSVDDLLKANPGIDPKNLQIGQEINQSGALESPITSGIKRVVKRAVKLGDEFSDLMPDLEREEGYREFAYPDPLNPKTGPITVGIGSTRTREAERVATEAGLDPSRVWNLNKNQRQGVAKDVATRMAGASLMQNEPKLRKMYPTYDQESASTRNVLRSMAYNMGTTGLSKFVDMKRAMTAGDTVGTRAAAMDSKRANQIPARAKREAEMMMPRPKKDETTGRWYSPLPPK